MRAEMRDMQSRTRDLETAPAPAPAPTPTPSTQQVTVAVYLNVTPVTTSRLVIREVGLGPEDPFST